MSYDPARHDRKSIRLKGWDYAGNGVYFITICAHRELMAVSNRKPFSGALRTLIEQRMHITAEKCPQMTWGEWVIMPDHFHALIRMKKGPLRLGDVIGGFKAAVSREWNKLRHPDAPGNAGDAAGDAGDAAGDAGDAAGDTTWATQVSPVRRGEACLAPSSIPAAAIPAAAIPAAAMPAAIPADVRMWHRNYYEIIVRSPEAERRIAEYIRMNPWKCVQELGVGLRGIGNPALWSCEKLGVLCSRDAPEIDTLPEADVYFSGWHSPKEKEMLAWLLKNERPVIACPARGIEAATFEPGMLEALEENRMLMLEMRDISGNIAAAEARNRFVIEHADALFTPHITQGGMLERLLNEEMKRRSS